MIGKNQKLTSDVGAHGLMGEQTDEGQLAEEVQEPGSKSLSPSMGALSPHRPWHKCALSSCALRKKRKFQVLITAYLFPMTTYWGDYSPSLSVVPYKSCMY